MLRSNQAQVLTFLSRLDTPKKIQDYLEKLAINFEKRGETCMSPRLVLESRQAHCMEGALFAAAALLLQGQKPLVMHTHTTEDDEDHAVALFRRGGRWGAISKTNHPVLRYRDPIYRTYHELAFSYFHEYFLNNGKKTLVSYSRPFSLKCFGTSWITSEIDLWHIDSAIANSPHMEFLPNKTKRTELRKADKLEIKASSLVSWPP